MIGYKDGLSFEIYVDDLLEGCKPKDAKDLEDISRGLHDRVEIAISDYIEAKELDWDYEPQY